jgi:hypothetical protein
MLMASLPLVRSLSNKYIVSVGPWYVVSGAFLLLSPPKAQSVGLILGIWPAESSSPVFLTGILMRSESLTDFDDNAREALSWRKPKS